MLLLSISDPDKRTNWVLSHIDHYMSMNVFHLANQVTYNCVVFHDIK